jgi:serine/threonine-protein kinase PknG
MTAVACPQPLCGGTIEDGYCNVCGLAPTTPRAGSGSAPAGSALLGSAPAGSAPAGSGSASVGSRPGSRSWRPGGNRSARGRLGAGLVEVPSVPALDPASAVLADPRVPESRRFCGSCGGLVGQSRDGQPGITEGFCPNCRARFSFAPKLRPGELVARQYEVLGCLAHGGLGWIYLAKDHNVSDRWVVLKGLLNTGDPDAMEVAVAEGRFLAQVEHPNIVKIFNFVQHTSQRDGETAGYIVMEYVGGKSLKQLRVEARQHGTAVPLAHALAYAIEILPALGYLHDRGLVYCDFKPDNVIQSEEQLKLIDLGGVRAIDSDGAIYGTVGYQAPEIETEGPSASSDLYTVGRALAVLTFDFAYQGEYKYRLPAAEPLLRQHESFARLLRRATHPDPKRRFQSAGELAEQLTGVLREVLSVADGEPRPSFSGFFSPELRAVGTDLSIVGAGVPLPPAAEVVAGLPLPLADGADPAARYLATLVGLEPEQQAATLRAAVAVDTGVPPAVSASPETKLALVRALLAVGAAGAAHGAATVLAELAAEDPADWRVAWHTGLLELCVGHPDRARAAFSAVYDELPGELAPKLALGFAAEAAGDLATALYFYQRVAVTDRSCVSAAFGAARACLAGGDRVGAVASVAAVPQTSSQHAAAQIAAIRLLVGSGNGVSVLDLRQAGGRLGGLSLDDLRREQLTVEILRAALDWVATAPPGPGRRGTPPGEPILGCEPTDRALRLGLERGYRALASLSPDQARRIELVDLANHVRPRTWI